MAGNDERRRPLAWLALDRREAQARGDPWANLCTFTTVDSAGHPQARVLVLRDIGEHLGVFVNATSPKCRELERSPHASVLLYLASLGVQYRLAATTRTIEAEIVHANWANRPVIPKAMDWVYTRHVAQSQPVESREHLIDVHTSVAAALHESSSAPPTAIGFYLDVHRLERLELASDRLHDRRLYMRGAEGEWRETVLVP